MESSQDMEEVVPSIGANLNNFNARMQNSSQIHAASAGGPKVN
jgi:hypothetical protein